MKHLFLITMFLFMGVKLFSQNDNLHFIHFTNYNVATDKLVQEALKSENVTYTCIPSGILAIQFLANDTDGEARIARLLNKKGLADSSFEFVVLTLETAESSCATYRNPE
ncbi:MAG: hypothetical protein M3R17_05460 [Bacteroidota bacterium]|nr:hypothetical protein [Bacteroidota bacterium]